MAAQSSVQVPDFDQAEAKTTAEILSALEIPRVVSRRRRQWAYA